MLLNNPEQSLTTITFKLRQHYHIHTYAIALTDLHLHTALALFAKHAHTSDRRWVQTPSSDAETLSSAQQLGHPVAAGLPAAPLVSLSARLFRTISRWHGRGSCRRLCGNTACRLGHQPGAIISRNDAQIVQDYAWSVGGQIKTMKFCFVCCYGLEALSDLLHHIAGLWDDTLRWGIGSGRKRPVAAVRVPMYVYESGHVELLSTSERPPRLQGRSPLFSRWYWQGSPEFDMGQKKQAGVSITEGWIWPQSIIITKCVTSLVVLTHSDLSHSPDCAASTTGITAGFTAWHPGWSDTCWERLYGAALTYQDGHHWPLQSTITTYPIIP